MFTLLNHFQHQTTFILCILIPQLCVRKKIQWILSSSLSFCHGLLVVFISCTFLAFLSVFFKCFFLMQKKYIYVWCLVNFSLLQNSCKVLKRCVRGDAINFDNVNMLTKKSTSQFVPIKTWIFNYISCKKCDIEWYTFESLNSWWPFFIHCRQFFTIS